MQHSAKWLIDFFTSIYLLSDAEVNHYFEQQKEFSQDVINTLNTAWSF